MELKTIIAVVLVLFILGGLIFLKVKKGRKECGFDERTI